MKRLLAVGALLLVLGPGARADSYIASQYSGDGNPNDTGSASNNGELLNGVYAGSFYVWDSQASQGFTAFAESLGNSGPAGGAYFWGTQSNGGVGNQLDYLLTKVVAEFEGWTTNAQAAALQLAIWQLTRNLNASSVTSDQSVLGFVGDIDSLLAGQQVTNSSWGLLNCIAAYQSTTTYASSSEFVIAPSSDYQVLIGVAPDRYIAPEPSTLMFAGLGALAFAGYGWKRRKRS